MKLPIFVDKGLARSESPNVPGRDQAEVPLVDRSREGRGSRIGAALFDHEDFAPVSEAPTRTSRFRRHRYHGGRPARRAASIAATAVAFAAIGVASWQLASGGSSPHHTTLPPSGSKTKGKSGHTGGGTPGQVITPLSVSTSVVAYATTSSHYTVEFSASGPCWLGVQPGVNGKYLWQTTLVAGGTASYQAVGSIAVRIGAPPYLKVELDGVSVQLPAQNVQPYDITFSPSRGGST